jgi:hypothetical protein
MKRFILFLVLGYLPLAIGGCGYTSRSLITDKYKTIYVPPFSNKIDISLETKTSRKYQAYRPLLETDITRSVIDRFMLDGNLRIAKEGEADLILRGALVNFRRDVLRYETDDTPEEYRINVVAQVGLWERKDNKLLWEQKNLIGDSTYFLSGPNVKSEDAAIMDATADLARRIVEKVVEVW